MNAFVIAAAALLVAIIPLGIVAWRGTHMEAIVAYESASSIAVIVLVLLAEGFQRSGEFELPVLLAVLLFGSGLVFVQSIDRWM